jgi:hypothetical protein
MTQFQQQNTNQTTRIHGKMYYDAFKHGWMPSLAYFVYLSVNFPHKRFKVEETGLNTKVLYKHLSILREKGLLTYKNGVVTIISNKKIIHKYHFNSGFRLFTKENTLKGIKQFLKSVPIISNLYRQKKMIEVKENFRRTYAHLKHNPLAKVKVKAYKALLKFTESHDIQDIRPIQMSLHKAGEILECSKPTAVKIRKYLNNVDIAKYQRRFKLVQKQVSEEFARQYISYSRDNGSRFLFYNSGNVYEEQSPVFILQLSNPSVSCFGFANRSISSVKKK